MDKDSCGVGFVAELSGESSHKTVTDALEMLVRMTHRGAYGVKPTLQIEQGSWWLYLTSFTRRVAEALDANVKRWSSLKKET
ncbi:hypothetical protein GYH30_033250 [Glycine max]|nr:hypothetical protein JHK87_033241 [Glycine soja]KAH1142470.1 hypothetical protein GYH30_033250 [Glycine max]